MLRSDNLWCVHHTPIFMIIIIFTYSSEFTTKKFNSIFCLASLILFTHETFFVIVVMWWWVFIVTMCIGKSVWVTIPTEVLVEITTNSSSFFFNSHRFRIFYTPLSVEFVVTDQVCDVKNSIDRYCFSSSKRVTSHGKATSNTKSIVVDWCELFFGVKKKIFIEIEIEIDGYIETESDHWTRNQYEDIFASCLSEK